MKPCIYCVEKHVAKAATFFEEARAGYPNRISRALGELAAAEEESPDQKVTTAIRGARKQLELKREETSPEWIDRVLTIVNTYREQNPIAAAAQRKMSERDQGVEDDCEGCDKKRTQPDRGRRPPRLPTVEQEPAPPKPNRYKLTPPTHRQREIVLLTCIQSWGSDYSLATVILDQARAARRAGYGVTVVGMKGMQNPHGNTSDVDGIGFHRLIPDVGWVDDTPDQNKMFTIKEALHHYLNSLRPGTIVITHDLMLQSWYYNVAWAIHELPIYHLNWYHQIHSSLGPRPHKLRWRTTVPDGHTILVATHDDVPKARSYYQTEAVAVLPTIRDPRSFLGLTGRAKHIYEVTKWYDAEISQVYPCSSPRMHAKGVYHVGYAMEELKNRGITPLLLIANAHLNSDGGRDQVAELRKRHGGIAEHMHFVSDIFPDLADEGLNTDDIRSLFLLSNVFMFPSVSESAGLVMLEAAMTGNLLVLNSDLRTSSDYFPHTDTPYVPWSSLTAPRTFTGTDLKEVAKTAAMAIQHQVNTNPIFKTRERMRRYTYERLGERMVALFESTGSES